MNIEIVVRRLAGQGLIDDYQRGAPELAPFFAGHPRDPEAYTRKAAEVRGRFDAAALDAVASAIRVPDHARPTLEAVARGDGFVVTTGQQPGLFGGPLYTVHKALSAIALAGRLRELLDAPVLPVFWIASDDHDWAEANHTYVLDTANELHRIELGASVENPRSMGQLELVGDVLETTLDELGELLPPSEFTPALMERLRSAYSGGTVAAGFGRLMEALFASQPLGFIDAQAAPVRRLAAPLIRRELARTEAHHRALAEQTARLEAAGYGAQVAILPGASNVFHEDESGRERLLVEGGGWLLRRSKRSLSAEELDSLLESEPERFSPNVVLRPVVESAILPTLAYVGGPGEVSYLAQTGCLFAEHGVGMPLVYPRAGVTLVEGKVRKVLDKFGLEVETFGRPVHEIVAEVVREEVPEEVAEAVVALRRAIQEGYGAVGEAAKSVDATLEGPITHARSESFRLLSDVERKIRHHLKSRNETGLDQLGKAAVNLAPEGRPQERVLNVHQYLARYGEGLVPAILERMDVTLESGFEGWTGVSCEG